MDAPALAEVHARLGKVYMAGTSRMSSQQAAATENGWRVPLQRTAVESVDLVTDSDTEESEEASGSDQEDPTWISWFCSLRGNEFFCEVDEDYIEDDFNLSGLNTNVPYYEYAIDMILDNDVPQDVILTDQQNEMLEQAAEMLYGLIHARYVLTARGLSAMLEKFKNCDFGRCPRVSCEGQPCLPVGTSDVPGQSSVKIFCPKCEEIYFTPSNFQVDGAYFGTTLPHLLLMTYPMHRPPKSTENYVPRVFGFKLHPSAYGNREQSTARDGPATAALPTAGTNNQAGNQVNQGGAAQNNA